MHLRNGATHGRLPLGEILIMDFEELKKKYNSGERKSIPTNKPVPERRRRFSPLTERLEKLGCFSEEEVDPNTNRAVEKYKNDGGNPFKGLTDETEIDRLTAYILDAKRNDLLKRGYSTYDAYEQARKYVDGLKADALKDEAKDKTEEPLLGEDLE